MHGHSGAYSARHRLPAAAHASTRSTIAKTCKTEQFQLRLHTYDIRERPLAEPSQVRAYLRLELIRHADRDACLLAFTLCAVSVDWTP